MPSNDNQIKTIDFADHSVINVRFNRFDDEFIDKNFNDEGKKAIKAYIDTHTQAEVEKHLRADRLANTKFWKNNIDKMFDREIAVYEEKKGE